MIEDIIRGMGGDFTKAIESITRDKYTYCKNKTNLSLYKMKSGKFKIMDYNKKNYGSFNDVDMAKKRFVELYEQFHGTIKL